jgi:hypothetical protein
MTGRRTVAVVGPVVVAVVLGLTPARITAADDILERSRAAYGELRAYADTGVVLFEYGSSSKDRHTFTTFFNRAPRHFYFDFKKDVGDRYVIWGDPDAFHTWWKTTGVEDDYPNPNNIGAFSTAGPHTVGSALMIPTLLYAKASLQGAFTNFTDALLDGTEVVGGRQCHRLVGTVHDTYGTGRETNVHKMTLWIDADSLLIRKVVEEWKALPGQISRTTTVFEPVANPALSGSQFRFTPPTAK